MDAELRQDEEYDGEDSASSGSEQSGYSAHSSGESSGSGMEKKAALLLMNLSVRDGEWGAGKAGMGPSGTGAGMATNAGTMSASAGPDYGATGTRPVLGISINMAGAQYREQLEVRSPECPRVKRRRATSL
jgi:hypothetical protein